MDHELRGFYNELREVEWMDNHGASIDFEGCQRITHTPTLRIGRGMYEWMRPGNAR